MKKSTFYPLARVASSLSLFVMLLCIHVTFTLVSFLTSDSDEIMGVVYICYYAGCVLGALLCPLLLPLPNGKKKLVVYGVCFIMILTAFEFVLRSLGVNVWLGSPLLRGAIAVPEGILTTMCYGLFYLTWLRKPRIKNEQESDLPRTNRFCSLVLGAALLFSFLARYYSVPLLKNTIAALEPFKGVEFSFNFIKWGMLVMGVLAITCVYSIQGEKVCSFASEKVKTDSRMILRLLGLASVFSILNGVLNMDLLPLYSHHVAVYHPHFLTVAVALLLIGFIAGRSIDRFIRLFIPPAMIIFILTSCLPLFKDYPQINMIMSTLLSITHYTIWVVFTTAVVEYYSGGFWFYSAAVAVFFAGAFTFLGPVIDPFVPDETEFRVLFIVIAALSFLLLSFRLIFPKTQKETPSQDLSPFEAIFNKHTLSPREKEVANLLVKEGLSNEEIGKRMFITAGTAKLHVNKIFQKFKVNSRAEFMALFVNKQT